MLLGNERLRLILNETITFTSMLFGWFRLLLDLNLRVLRIHSIYWRDLPCLNLNLQIRYLLLQSLYTVKKLINLLGLRILHGCLLGQLFLDLLKVFTSDGRLTNCCTVHGLTGWYAWISGTNRGSRTVSQHVLRLLHLGNLFLKVTAAWHSMLLCIPQIPISSLRSWCLRLLHILSNLNLLWLYNINLLHIFILILEPRNWRCRKALTCSEIVT